MITSGTIQSVTFGFLRIAARLVGRLLLATMLVACAEKPLPVSLTYTPDRNIQPTGGAESVHVEVAVNDRRQEKNILGEASNG